MHTTFVHPKWGLHEAPFHEFSSCMASYALEIAMDSYRSPENSGSTLEEIGFQGVQLIDNDNLQAVIGRKEVALGPDDNRTLYALSFRGSDEVEDLIMDLDFRMRHFPVADSHAGSEHYKVHNGMFTMEQHLEYRADSILFSNEAAIDNLLEVFEQDDKKNRALFLICGHSLGGGIATIFALRLLEHYGFRSDQVAVYAFGAPPIACKHLAKRYSLAADHKHRSKAHIGNRNINLYRFANIDDPVSGADMRDVDHAYRSDALISSIPYTTVGLHHVGLELLFSPKLIPDFYEAFKAKIGRLYSHHKVLDTHSITSYSIGLESTLSTLHDLVK